MKALILGAGEAQIDAIEYCKEQGIEVYGCSYTSNDPGIPLLDGFEQVDIKDVDGVIAYARSIGADVIYSVGSDLAMPTAMKASEALDAPHFLPSEVAEICQNKSVLRKTLSNSRFNLPYIVVSSVDQASKFNSFPGMMKPVDSQGQRGCFRVDSFEDVEAHFDESLSFSKSGNVIIEKFVDGPEMSVNVFLLDGKVVFAMLSDRYSFDEYPGGIIKEHGLPCRFINQESQQLVLQLVNEVVERLGLRQGPVYFQIKADGEGNPYLIEVTPRLDGCHMWRFIKRYCGVDLLAASFELLLGGRVQTNMVPEPREGYWKLTFTCAPPNTAFDRSRYDMKDSEESRWYYETGENVRVLNGFMEKCGYKIHRVSD